MAERKIEVVISAVDDYSAMLKKLNDALGMTADKVDSTSSRMQKSWTETAIKIGAVSLALKKFYGYAEEASAVSQEVAFAMERFNRALDIGKVVMGKAFVALASYTTGGLLFAASGFTELLRSLINFISKVSSLGEYLPGVGGHFKGLTEWLKHTEAGLDGVSSEFMDMSMAAFQTGNTVVSSIGRSADEVDRLRKKTRDAAKEFEDFKKRIDEISMGPAAGSFTALYGSTALPRPGELNFSMGAWPDEGSGANAEREDTALEKLSAMKNPYGGYQETDQFSSAYSAYDSKLKELETYNATRLQLLEEAGASELALEAEYAAMSNQYALARRDFQVDMAGQTFGAMSNLMQNLYVASGAKSRAMFKMMKGFAITEAVINTAQAITAALKNPPGPPFSFAYATAAAAAGAAQIATIASSEPGSRQTISATGNASPGYAGGSPMAYPVPTRTEAQPVQHVTLNVHTIDPSVVNWDNLMEKNIAPALERLSGQRNVELDIKVVKR